MRSLTPPQRTAAKDACFVAVGFVGAAAAAHAIRRAARKLEDNKRPGTALALRATTAPGYRLSPRARPGAARRSSGSTRARNYWDDACSASATRARVSSSR